MSIIGDEDSSANIYDKIDNLGISTGQSRNTNYQVIYAEGDLTRNFDFSCTKAVLANNFTELSLLFSGEVVSSRDSIVAIYPVDDSTRSEFDILSASSPDDAVSKFKSSMLYKRLSYESQNPEPNKKIIKKVIRNKQEMFRFKNLHYGDNLDFIVIIKDSNSLFAFKKTVLRNGEYMTPLTDYRLNTDLGIPYKSKEESYKFKRYKTPEISKIMNSYGIEAGIPYNRILIGWNIMETVERSTKFPSLFEMRDINLYVKQAFLHRKFLKDHILGHRKHDYYQWEYDPITKIDLSQTQISAKDNDNFIYYSCKDEIRFNLSYAYFLKIYMCDYTLIRARELSEEISSMSKVLQIYSSGRNIDFDMTRLTELAKRIKRYYRNEFPAHAFAIERILKPNSILDYKLSQYMIESLSTIRRELVSKLPQSTDASNTAQERTANKKYPLISIEKAFKKIYRIRENYQQSPIDFLLNDGGNSLKTVRLQELLEVVNGNGEVNNSFSKKKQFIKIDSLPKMPSGYGLEIEDERSTIQTKAKNYNLGACLDLSHLIKDVEHRETIELELGNEINSIGIEVLTNYSGGIVLRTANPSKTPYSISAPIYNNINNTTLKSDPSKRYLARLLSLDEQLNIYFVIQG